MVIHDQSAFGSAAFTGLINSIWHFNCSWFGYLKVFNSNFLHFFSSLLPPEMSRGLDVLFLFEWRLLRMKCWAYYLIFQLSCEESINTLHFPPGVTSLHWLPICSKKITIATSVITYVTNANVCQCMFDFLNYWIDTLKDAYAVNLDRNFFRMRQYVRLASWMGSKQNCTNSVTLWC